MTTTVFAPTTDLKPETATSPGLLRYVVLDARKRRRMARRKLLLIALEINGRATLSELAKEVNAPISTVFDDLQAIWKEYRIVLHTRSAEPPTPLGCLPEGWQHIQQRKRERQERIIAALRQDARAPLARLSRQLNIPLSTLSEEMDAVSKRVSFTIERKSDRESGHMPADEAVFLSAPARAEHA